MNRTSHLEALPAFVTTKWTVILEAARMEPQRSDSAFAQLYRDYWKPLYAYVRRRGLSPEAAEDLTQEFFLALLSKQRLAGLSREGGRFRSFLLVGLKHHLANEWDRGRALKRGGGQSLASLDMLQAEHAFQAQAPLENPELEFERDWAFEVLSRALDRLRQEMEQAGRGKLFAAVQPHLQGDRNGRPYAAVAAELGISEPSLKVNIHRLRHRFGEVLRGEIGRTVCDESAVNDELRELLRIVSKVA